MFYFGGDCNALIDYCSMKTYCFNSGTTNTYNVSASEPCSFGTGPPVNQSLIQPAATYAAVSTSCVPSTQEQQDTKHATQTTIQQTHPALQSSLMQAQPSTSAVLPQAGLPIAFVPVAELRTMNKTNDPSKIKSSGDKVSNDPLGSLTIIANDLPGLESMPVLHIDDCDPSSEDVLMGRVHTASIIHPSQSGNSPDKIETVRIVGYELPKDCQQIINESPSSKRECVVAKDPVFEQLKEARKPGVISRGKSPSQHAPPRKQKRFRNYSSPSEELSSQSDEKETDSVDRRESAHVVTISDSEEQSHGKGTGYHSDGFERSSICSTDSVDRKMQNSTGNGTAAKQDIAQEEVNPDSPVHRPCTRSRTRSKTIGNYLPILLCSIRKLTRRLN